MIALFPPYLRHTPISQYVQRESILSGEKVTKIKKEPADKPAAKPKSPPAVTEPTVVIPETPVTEKRKSSNDDLDGASNLSSESYKKVKVFIVLVLDLPFR